MDIIFKKKYCLKARIACLVCLVCTLSGHCKNTLGRASASGGLLTKLEQSTFLRYLWSSVIIDQLERNITGDGYDNS
jgi:hypothetical protein